MPVTIVPMKEIAVENPASGEILGQVPDFDAESVNRLVGKAQDAFDKKSWRGKSGSEREALLWRAAELVEKEAADFALLSTLEAGKPIRDSRSGDVGGAIDAFRYFAGAVRRFGGRRVPVDGPFLNFTELEPLGVVGAIVPWNYPLCLAAWKLAPALAAGCSVVLKPSELTPFGALKLESTLREAGLPEGVFQVATGFGNTTGEALARHAGVAKIAFTGSPQTARRLLMASAESNLKPVSLELGGKTANIVFADANLPAAARQALWGIFTNQGQICTAASRLLIEESVYEEFLAVILERAKRLRVGDPRDVNVEIGPLISAKQKQRVLEYVRAGLSGGAELLLGRDTELPPQGHYVAPTIFGRVDPRAKIAQEEIFGPVLSVIPFRDEAQAIAIANSTSYGLAAAVWTENVRRAQRMARELHAGVVWVNAVNEFDSASPFGGVRESGSGRDLGEEAMREYSSVKSIWLAH